MNFDKKNQKEKLGNNSTYSHQIKFITKKKFPVMVQYKTPIWNEELQSNTNFLEKEFLHEGIVFNPKKLTKKSFELHNHKGKICKFYFEEGTFSDYCNEFKGDSIEVESELVKPNNQ